VRVVLFSSIGRLVVMFRVLIFCRFFFIIMVDFMSRLFMLMVLVWCFCVV